MSYKPFARKGKTIVFVENTSMNMNILQSISSKVKVKFPGYELMLKGRGPKKLRTNYNNINLDNAPYIALSARVLEPGYNGGWLKYVVFNKDIETFVIDNLIKTKIITKEQHNQHVVLRGGR